MIAANSRAETFASRARDRPAFNKLNLAGIKSEVSQALRLIGTNGIFKEYTLHDISHIDKMLELLDRIIPTTTADKMSDADWLLTVLSIYFHDLGLLVTEEEFKGRDASGFEAYKNDHLFAGADGAEYASKVAALPADEAERFLYQEFVRAHHASRIADWIRGKGDSYTGIATSAAEAVAGALKGLPEIFLEDLARVCESHHLNDLDDRDKYPVRQPYGDLKEETANVQYSAVLLRTVDLLHITLDRTPSTTFKLINPQDPISQREWAKQRSVRTVTPQLGKDADGNASESAPKNTLEVHARFKDADGFFGLMAYLRYTRDQLLLSHQWTTASQVRDSVPHEFPWTRIDDTHVKAEGFLPRHLSFTLDQKRILELLTGHTIYNDTSVVIRELAQNAIDAVRLQKLDKPSSSASVTVEWDSTSRVLIVRDTGTGMSQKVIENNLLKAGASRYHEEEFKRLHSDFSPISRFGIGVLSAFMIADAVEIITCSPEDEQARVLTLRSVHDAYLVRLLDKRSAPELKNIGEHGTEVRLRVRETATFPDVATTLRNWVIIPRCDVRVSVNGNDPLVVGHATCREALESALHASGVEVSSSDTEPNNSAVRVVSHTAGGVETALAVGWNDYFREWSFIRPEQLGDDWPQSVGVCVEGIRVEDLPPGFSAPSIVAISNAVGRGAPKTNVARSGLEATPERSAMLRQVYDAFARHVHSELTAMVAERGFSTTWAAQEAEFLLDAVLSPRSLTGDGARATEPRLLDEMVAQHELIVVEDGDGRRLASGSDLQKHELLWTVDSAFVRAGESLLREVPNDASLAALASGLDTDAVDLPAGTTLVGYRERSPLHRAVLDDREISAIKIARDQRRVDLGWSLSDEQPRWVSLAAASRSTAWSRRRLGFAAGTDRVWVGLQPIEVEGRELEVAARAHGFTLVFADTPIARHVSEIIDDLPAGSAGRPARAFIATCISRHFDQFRKADDTLEWVEYLARQDEAQGGRGEAALLHSQIDIEELAKALDGTSVSVFDPSAWRRTTEVDSDF